MLVWTATVTSTLTIGYLVFTSDPTMAASLLELNTIGSSAGLPTRPLRDLPLGHDFLITAAKKVNTRYGKRLLVTCTDFVVFLPEAYSTVSDSTIVECNNGIIKLAYIGEINGASRIRFS